MFQHTVLLFSLIFVVPYSLPLWAQDTAINVRPTVIQSALRQPWGLAFLPDGRMLVTEKNGQFVYLSADGVLIARFETPFTVVSTNQGGLLDVVVHPQFNLNRLIYWTYSEPEESGGNRSGTAVARAQFIDGQLRNSEVIYRQKPKVSGSGHFGSRLVFDVHGYLFVSLGERQKEQPAQDLATSLGKVIRLYDDGKIPSDNPFVGQNGVLPEIWSWGHRNPQGLAINPINAGLYVNEHGPRGGDEINRVRPKANYGWPITSYGCPYLSPLPKGLCEIGDGRHAPKFVEPLSVWSPSIAPSGMMFYSGKNHPAWRGAAFIGALAGRALWRVHWNEDKEQTRSAILPDFGERIRDVREGPDGFIYLLTDAGQLVRLAW